MHDLLKYIIGTAIVMGLFSYLYRKKGAIATSRVIRLFLGMASIFFLVISLGLVLYLLHLFLGKGSLSHDEILICSIFLPFTFILGISFLITTISKKYSDRWAKEFEFSEAKEKSSIEQKRTDLILWILGIIMLICAAIAFATYNLFFFILFFILLLVMLGIRIKRGYW